MNDKTIKITGDLTITTPISSSKLSNPTAELLLLEAMKAIIINESEEHLTDLISRIDTELGENFKSRMLESFKM